MFRITLHFERGHGGRRPSSWKAWPAIVLVLLLFTFAIGAAVDARAAPKAGGGGKPPPSGTPQTLPVNLGAPGGCSNTYGIVLNTGATPADTTVGVQTFCSGPSNLPYYWRNGQWFAAGLLPGMENGSVESESDLPTETGKTGPTLSGTQIGGGEGMGFVLMPGRGLLQLPMLPGFRWVNQALVTGDGKHIVGQNSTDTDFVAVRWTWSTAESRWLVARLWDGQGGVAGASDDGSVIIGGSGSGGAVFMDGDSRPTPLGSGKPVRVNDITPDGRFIVGYEMWPCTSKPGCEYPRPVYWRLQNNGSWAMSYLAALDGVDSEARGVAVVNNRVVIVGWGFTKSDAIRRAVAWLPDAKGAYGAPMRLAAIEGRSKSSARAEDINRHGQVLGTSQATGVSSFAVLWTLTVP